jgi:hypothetical protein
VMKVYNKPDEQYMQAVAKLGQPEPLPDYAGRMPVLNERGKTHGDFTANGEIMQATKMLWRVHPGWQKLPPYAREALEMNAHKVGRILCGKWDTKDHWVDIAGYANLVAERCEEDR